MMRPIHILLVEDNEGDILLTQEALEDSRIINRITIKRDGKAAIDYLEGLAKTEQGPDLVLLDINLPRRSGHEVLRYIKEGSQHRSLPVIMLTTSSAEKDVLAAYAHYANCYITKPIDADEFVRAIIQIEHFWINIVTIPSSAHGTGSAA